MKTRFLFILLSALVTTLSGCDKDDNGNDPVATGVVKGSVLPAYGVKEIYLVSGTDTQKTIPNAPAPFELTGTFEFNQVKPGNYKVGVNSIINFTTPAPVAINVASGQTVEVPKFELYSASNGIMTLTYNDTVYSGSPVLAGNMVYLPMPKYTFWLTLPQITGPGTFTTATHPLLQARVYNWKQENWYADQTKGFATVTVSSMHPVSKIGNATFSFTAVSPGKPDMVVTKGSLYSVRLNN